MKTLHDLLKYATSQFEENKIDNPRRQAQDLLCDCFNLKRVQLYMELERPITEDEWSKCNEKIQRRRNGEPLQYIHGTVDFYNCSLIINPSVLIPRPETEILVDKLVKRLENQILKKKSFWDICTGSGCIGIAIKKRFPELDVYLSDISLRALEVAKQNAKRNEVDVSLLQGDLLDPFLNKKTHYLVSNPPYISKNEFQDLDIEVKNFEPYNALVAGDKGMEIYERFSKILPQYLHPKSLVAFEIGATQGASINKLFQGPPWVHQNIENDWAGHSRFFFLENE